MNRTALSTALVVLAAACSDNSLVAPSSRSVTPSSDPSLSLFSSGTVTVTNANDQGNGSFRQAVLDANANAAIRRIEFRSRIGTIKLASGVTYTGAQGLTIDGNGATIDGAALPAGQSSVSTTGGSDLSVSSLTLKNAPGEGLRVLVPGTATGTLKVSLLGVEVLGNKGHGVLINDQVDPSTTDGVQPNANGSAASLEVIVLGCRFSGNGFSVSDRDGLRINEGGEGSLTVSITATRSDGNGADGVELDERGAGDVKFSIVGSQLVGNGQFDPADLDDGFDIDEYNDGSIFGKVILTSANDNYEEGFDFNENNAGDMRIDFSLSEASRNREEGIDLEEDDDFAGGGELVTTMIGVKANGNRAGDAGVKIREKGDGNLDATLKAVVASDNLTRGIQVREGDAGNLVSSIEYSSTTGNTSHGIDFQESSTGDLTATVANSTSSGNTGAGVQGDESSTGNGTVQLVNVTFGSGNTGGNTAGNVTFVVAP